MPYTRAAEAGASKRPLFRLIVSVYRAMSPVLRDATSVIPWNHVANAIPTIIGAEHRRQRE